MKKYVLIFILLGFIFIYGLMVIVYSLSNSDENSPYYYAKKSLFTLLPDGRESKIIMLGDSITEGCDWNELLNRNDIINRGIGGDTSSGVRDRLNRLNPRLEKAFIMIGINDLTRQKDVKTIFTNYKQIIDILRKKNITPIIQSTLYTGKSKENQYNKKVEQLNKLLYQYASDNNITFVDLNSVLSPNGVLSEKYTDDDIHINGEGYTIWKNSIKKYF